MADRAGRSPLRRLLARRSRKEARLEGRELLLTGRETLIALERTVSDALVGDDRSLFSAESGGNGTRSPIEELRPGATAALEHSCGLALTGRRVATLLSPDGLGEVRSSLARAVRRRTPLVVHAPLEAGHRAYHALADTGACLLMARDPQHAVLLALAARRISELALVPCVVATDVGGTDAATSEVVLPSPSQIETLLGSPGDEIDVPTGGQRLLFGEKRRRVPAWFDLDRPLALLGQPAARDAAPAAESRRAILERAVAEIVRDCLEEVSSVAGRVCSALTGFEVGRGRPLIVAQGDLVELAEAARERLRSAERIEIGVLGIDCLRPLPGEELRELIESAGPVLTLERCDGADLAGPPLWRELRAATVGRSREVAAVLCGAEGAPVTGADITAAVRAAAAGSLGERVVRLGVEPLGSTSELPRREAMLQRLGRELQDAEPGVLQGEQGLELAPSSATVVKLAVAGPRNDSLLASATAALRPEGAERIRCRWSRPEDRFWTARIAFAPEALRAVADDQPVDLLVVSMAATIEGESILDGVRDGGRVIVTGAGSVPESFALPPSWRAAARDRGLGFLAARSEPNEWLVAASAILAGEDVEELPLEPAPEKDGGIAARRMRIVDRLAGPGPVHEVLARFWGESAQPRLAGGPGSRTIDPALALDASPPASAALRSRRPLSASIPSIDPSACTGCGACWTLCPDGAIAAAAVSTLSLLEACSSGVDGGMTAGRATRQLAGLIDTRLASAAARELSGELVREAAQKLLERSETTDEDRAELESIVTAAEQGLGALGVTATEELFHAAHRERRGGGRLLTLAIDPLACQACGICAEICPEVAIEIRPVSDPSFCRELSGWQLVERMPDTEGATIERAANLERPGPAGAITLSRHTATALAGADGAEPGSGERMALRLVAAVMEHELQRRQVSRIESLDALFGRARQAIRSVYEETIDLDDLSLFEQSLDRGRAGQSSGAVARRVDERRLRRLIDAARATERLSSSLAKGPGGQGRARFGIVFVGSRTVEWATAFGRNPLQVPVLSALGAADCEQAAGIARALRESHLSDARSVRRLRCMLEPPVDLEAELARIAGLGWADLTPEERAECPPLLVIADGDAWARTDAAGLLRLLTSGLGVKLILLDGRNIVDSVADPTMVGLAARDAFVVAASVGHPDHLAAGLSLALAFDGPGLVHVHAPSPLAHGFDSSRTVERARRAVESRVHPLVVYDPGADGVFGTRLDLSGNPEPKQAWACRDGEPQTPASWAAGESRYSRCFGPERDDAQPAAAWLALAAADRDRRPVAAAGPGGAPAALTAELASGMLRRIEIWRGLQEICGLVTPFTERVRAELEEEMRREREGAVEELRTEHAREKADLAERQRRQDVIQLRNRLLELAGYETRVADQAPEPPEA